MVTIYAVQIPATLNGGSGEGFIDKKRLEYYLADEPSYTYEEAQAKRRANVRFDILQQQLQLLGNIYLRDVITVGADMNGPGSSLNFTMFIEHGIDSVSTVDEYDEDGTVLVGEDALRRAIMRTLLINRSQNIDVYDPTESTTPTNTESVARRGYRVEILEVGQAASSPAVAAAAAGSTTMDEIDEPFYLDGTVNVDEDDFLSTFSIADEEILFFDIYDGAFVVGEAKESFAYTVIDASSETIGDLIAAVNSNISMATLLVMEGKLVFIQNDFPAFVRRPVAYAESTDLVNGIPDLGLPGING